MNTTRVVIYMIVFAALSAGCTRAVVYKENPPGGPVVVDNKDGNGPPPWAPAHGHRRNHEKDDVVLVYDARLDVYVVSGYKDCYYSAGQYFRFVDDSWEWSVTVSSGWKFVASHHDIPSSLYAKYGKGKGHGKDNKHKKH